MHCAGIAECSGVTAFGVKDLAMHWCKQLKSEKCFLKNVVSFKYGRIISARAVKLQYQTKTAESFRKTEERN